MRRLAAYCQRRGSQQDQDQRRDQQVEQHRGGGERDLDGREPASTTSGRRLRERGQERRGSRNSWPWPVPFSQSSSTWSNSRQARVRTVAGRRQRALEAAGGDPLVLRVAVGQPTTASNALASTMPLARWLHIPSTSASALGPLGVIEVQPGHQRRGRPLHSGYGDAATGPSKALLCGASSWMRSGHPLQPDRAAEPDTGFGAGEIVACVKPKT